MMVNSRLAELTVNRWLSRQQDDSDVWREIPVSFSGQALLPGNLINNWYFWAHESCVACDNVYRIEI